MAYALFQADSVTNAIKVLAKKDPALLKQLGKKLEKLLEDPYGAGKWMHGAYAGVREVHILGKRFCVVLHHRRCQARSEPCEIRAPSGKVLARIKSSRIS